MLLTPLFNIISTYILALLGIAFFTLLERKILSYSQRRKGPNKVSLLGLPQPLADAGKLLSKETFPPNLANSGPFIICPMLSLFLSLLL